MRKVEGYLAENMSKTNLSEILKTSVKFEVRFESVVLEVPPSLIYASVGEIASQGLQGILR